MFLARLFPSRTKPRKIFELLLLQEWMRRSLLRCTNRPLRSAPEVCCDWKGKSWQGSGHVRSTCHHRQLFHGHSRGPAFPNPGPVPETPDVAEGAAKLLKVTDISSTALFTAPCQPTELGALSSSAHPGRVSNPRASPRRAWEKLQAEEDLPKIQLVGHLAGVLQGSPGGGFRSRGATSQVLGHTRWSSRVRVQKMFWCHPLYGLPKKHWAFFSYCFTPQLNLPRAAGGYNGN